MPTDTPTAAPVRPRSLVSDDTAYLGPMMVFLLITWVGGTWPSLFPISYAVKTIVVALILIKFWKHYTTITWDYWWLGVIVGALVTVQWVGMEKLLPGYPKMSHGEIFDPWVKIHGRAMRWAFIAVRWAGASLLVPVMEELFWRDYLWRALIAPNDFKLARVGEWDRKAFIIVAIAFGAGVHFEWITAIVCGVIYGGLLLYTRSLGACIIAHGVTNFLLGAYVLKTGDWAFW